MRSRFYEPLRTSSADANRIFYGRVFTEPDYSYMRKARPRARLHRHDSCTVTKTIRVYGSTLADGRTNIRRSSAVEYSCTPLPPARALPRAARQTRSNRIYIICISRRIYRNITLTDARVNAFRGLNRACSARWSSRGATKVLCSSVRSAYLDTTLESPLPSPSHQRRISRAACSLAVHHQTRRDEECVQC